MGNDNAKGSISAESILVENDSEQMAVRRARALFAEGNAAFRKKGYDEAKEKYSAALGVLKNSCEGYGVGVNGVLPAGSSNAKPNATANRGGNDQDPPVLVANALSNLGILSFAEGRYNEAKALLGEALALRRSLPGKTEVKNLSTLSTTLRKDFSCPQTTSSHNSLVARIERHERIDSATADSLNNLAAIYELCGDYTQAMELYQESLSLRMVLYGHNSLKTAESLSNLGGALDNLGLLEEALPLMRTAVAVHENLLGHDSAETSLLLNNLGVLLCHLGQYEEAEEVLTRVVTIRSKTYGSTHYFTGCARQNLAYVRNRRQSIKSSEVRMAVSPDDHGYGYGYGLDDGRSRAKMSPRSDDHRNCFNDALRGYKWSPTSPPDLANLADDLPLRTSLPQNEQKPASHLSLSAPFHSPSENGSASSPRAHTTSSREASAFTEKQSGRKDGRNDLSAPATV